MSPNTMKCVGVACLVVCAILLFVAWERYQNNADQVRAASGLLESSPLGGMMKGLTGGASLEPTMPTSSKYCIAFAVLFGVGGIVFLVLGMKNQPGSGEHADQPETLAGSP